MAQLNKEAIKYLAKLCRIDCTEQEQDALLHDLSNILDFFNQLLEINTEGIPPCDNVLEGITNVLRDDTVGEVMSREVFLSLAPAHVGGMIRVPPVLKQNP